MTDTVDIILAALAKPDHRALRISTAICTLVKDGGILGELEQRVTIDAGQARGFLVPPEIWFDRLAVALRTGAVDRMEPERIAERILTSPPPAGDAPASAA